jgi:hypothetical protein
MRDFCFNGTTHIATPLTSQLLEDYNISFILAFSPAESVFIDEVYTFVSHQVHTTGITGGRILFVNKHDPDGYFALYYTKISYSRFRTGDFSLRESELEFFDTEAVKESLSIIESATNATDRERSVFNLFYTIETRRLRNNESS